MKEAELSQFIYRFLILNGNVNLPGLGSLEILHLPAINDLNKQLISSPSSVTKFRNDQLQSESSDLIKYLVRNLNIAERNASEMLSAFCAEIKNEIESGSVVSWRGLGKFSKSSEGFFVFENQHPDAFDQEVVCAESTNHSDGFLTTDEADSALYQSDNTQPTFVVNFKNAVILLISIILLFIIIRYSFGNFELLGSRYEKFHSIDPPSTYKQYFK